LQELLDPEFLGDTQMPTTRELAIRWNTTSSVKADGASHPVAREITV